MLTIKISKTLIFEKPDFASTTNKEVRILLVIFLISKGMEAVIYVNLIVTVHVIFFFKADRALMLSHTITQHTLSQQLQKMNKGVQCAIEILLQLFQLQDPVRGPYGIMSIENAWSPKIKSVILIVLKCRGFPPFRMQPNKLTVQSTNNQAHQLSLSLGFPKKENFSLSHLVLSNLTFET